MKRTFGLKGLSCFSWREQQKKHGLKYFTKNSAPFHCPERTRYTQTGFLADIPFR
ncbi:MAG: hypothetical protein P4L35_00290 [Ignavibacteriaceae bacterium]|nr:hypothetical protein [Ignavibacteriaceae bacterium]